MVGDDGPGGRIGKPLLGPFIIGWPVCRGSLLPEAKGPVVEHDRLPDLMTAAYVPRMRERYTEAPPRELVESGERRDRCSVVVHGQGVLVNSETTQRTPDHLGGAHILRRGLCRARGTIRHAQRM